MSPRRTATLIAGALAGLLAGLAVVPASASPARGFTSAASRGVVVLRGGPAGDGITLSVRSGRLRHDAGAGDRFAGAFDFDTNRAGVQSIRVANLRLVRVLGGAGNDHINLAGGRGYPSLDLEGGPGTDTIGFTGDVRSRGSIRMVADRIGGGVRRPGRTPLTIAGNITASGTISLTTTDNGPASGDDDITVNAGVSVTSTGGSVTLGSGDAIVLQAGSSLNANQALTLNTDVSNTDATPNGDVLADGDLHATNGAISITTGSGADTVRLAGAITSGTTSSISTGAGNDTVDVRGSTIFPGTADGGADTDTVDFTNAGSSVTADLAGGVGNRFTGALSNFENAIGSPFGDTLRGNAGPNTLSGGDGADILVGRDGDDTLNGGPNDDRLFGDRGNDGLHGDDGNDHLEGGAQKDTLDGGANDDTLLGGGGADTVVGGTGFDSLDGGSANDHLDSADGVTGEQVKGKSGFDTCTTDAGDVVTNCEA
jgi:Ca2+-binding RTX toxin-like protein